jgi:hypothetical protein
MTQSNVSSANGSRSASPFTAPPHSPWRELAGFEHRADDPAHFLELALGVVERDDGGAAPPGLERVTATAAPHVEHLGAVLHAEAIEVGREHQATPAAA